MLKKNLLTITMVLTLLVAFSGTAFAKNDNDNGNGGGAGIHPDMEYMTDTVGGEARQPKKFHLDEDAWQYITLDQPGTRIQTQWWWSGDIDTLYQFDSENVSPDFTMDFLTIGSVTDYTKMYVHLKTKFDGQWHIDKFTINGNEVNGRSMNFTYAPEPVSSALFLLGGAVLAVRNRRKNKKT